MAFHTDTMTLTLTAAGALSADPDLQAGAAYSLVLTGVTFQADRSYRLTVKPTRRLFSPSFVVTVTDLEQSGTDRTGTLNLHNAGLIAYCGDTSRRVKVEVWDNTQNRPVARGTLLCYAPVQRDDDVPDQSQPARTLTDEQIAAMVPPVDVASLPSGDDLVTGRIYRLTDADDSVLVPPGIYYHDGTYWHCLTPEGVYDLGDLTGAETVGFVSGVVYEGYLAGHTTLSVDDTLPVGGLIMFDYATHGYTMTEANFSALFAGDLDDLSAALVRLVIERTSTAYKASAKERI